MVELARDMQRELGESLETYADELTLYPTKHTPSLRTHDDVFRGRTELLVTGRRIYTEETHLTTMFHQEYFHAQIASKHVYRTTRLPPSPYDQPL